MKNFVEYFSNPASNVDATQYDRTFVEGGKVVKVVPRKGTITTIQGAFEIPKTFQEKVPKVKRADGQTLSSMSRQLYMKSSDKSLRTVVPLFMEKLEISKAMAYTYYYNAKKKCDVQ